MAASEPQPFCPVLIDVNVTARLDLLLSTDRVAIG